jgi:hypothetical protein
LTNIFRELFFFIYISGLDLELSPSGKSIGSSNFRTGLGVIVEPALDSGPHDQEREASLSTLAANARE